MTIRGEFTPEFKKWLTITAHEALGNGQYSPAFEESTAHTITDTGVIVAYTHLGERVKETAKRDSHHGTKHTLRYLGRINLYEEKKHFEVLLLEDGRVWTHTDFIHSEADSDRGFADVHDVDVHLEKVISP